MKAVLFDVDDTLMDFKKCSYYALKKALLIRGHRMDDHFYESFMILNQILWKEFAKGNIERDILLNQRWKFLFEQTRIDVDHQGFDLIFQDCLKDEYFLIDGAIDLLEYLYPKYDLYIVSNGVLIGQKYRLKKSGIDKYFKDFFISEAIGYSKLRIEFFDYCLDKIKCNKEDVIIIGDSIDADIKGGKNAGIKTCYVNLKRNINHVVCDYEVHSLKEIKAFL